MSTMTANELFDSLTGRDESAIAAHFGVTTTALAKRAQPDAEDLDPFPFLRALIFVDKRRGGLDDTAAFEATQDLTIAQLQEYFVDDDEEDEGKAPSA